MIPQEYFNKIKKFFDGDEEKAWDWFKKPNSRFGMFAPIDLLRLGKEKRVIQMIDNLINGEWP